jgi:hypothetical protein
MSPFHDNTFEAATSIAAELRCIDFLLVKDTASDGNVVHLSDCFEAVAASVTEVSQENRRSKLHGISTIEDLMCTQSISELGPVPAHTSSLYRAGL